MGSKKLVLYAGFQDDTNCCNKWARATNVHSTKYRARVVTAQAHPFGYAEDVTFAGGAVGSKELEEKTKLLAKLAEQCDVCVLVGTHYDHPAYLTDYVLPVADSAAFTYPNFGRHLQGKPVMVRHQGTIYRENSRLIDVIDVAGNIASRLVAPDLLHKAQSGLYGRVRQTYRKDYPYLHVVEKAETTTAPKQRSEGKPPVVLHCPSNEGKKGTVEIRQAIMPLYATGQIEYVEVSGVSWAESMAAKWRCDIYIDQLKPDIGGYGLSAIEAMSYGVPAIASTCNVNTVAHTIRSFWEPPPVLNAGSAEELTNVLRELTDPGRWKDESQRAFDWCQKYATGKAVSRFMDEVYDEVLEGFHGEG